MAAIKDTKTVYADPGNALTVIRQRYDFSKDGGATGALDIITAGEALVIHSAWMTVKTACTSGGSATMIWGITGTTNLFCNTTQGAVANLTAAATIVPPAVEGTPNTLALPVKLASGAKVLQTIGTAAMTAGVIEYCLVVSKA